MPNNGTQNLAVFPKGSVPTKVSFEIPDDDRTRGESTGQSLPLWDVSGPNLTTTFNVRYGIYTSDGKLFYSSETAGENIAIAGLQFDLTVPMPPNDPQAKIFVWADQLGENSSSFYIIDWNAKTLQVSQRPQADLTRNMAKKADAFCIWDNVKKDDYSRTRLYRPFVQVNIVSDEFKVPGVKEAYKYGTDVACSLISKGGEEFLPYKWNWETDKVELTKSIGWNYTYNPLGYDYWGSEIQMISFPKAQINGREFEYLGVFYLLAPRDANGWFYDTEGTAINGFRFRIQALKGENNADTGTQPIALRALDIPKMKANERVVFFNPTDPNDSDHGEGILTSSSDWSGSIASGFVNGKDNPVYPTISLVRE